MTTLSDLFAAELENQFKIREESTGIMRENWLVAGSSPRSKRDPETAEWWEDQGPAFVRAWLDWRQSEGIKIWKTPDGRPAIELDLVVDLGGVKAKGIIDRVMVSKDDSLGIVDLKGGNSTPESPFPQLVEYKAAVEVEYGVTIKWGMFWSPRKDRQYPINLERWTVPLVRNLLLEYAKLQPVQAYPPRVGRHCDWCGVNAHCAAYGGTLASQSDPSHPDYEGSR